MPTGFGDLDVSMRDREKGRRIIDSLYVFEDRASPLALGYPCLIELEGNTFVSAEQMMLYIKAKCFDDHVAQRRILSGYAGRISVAGFKPWIWKQYEYKALVFVSSIKMQQCIAAKDTLKETGAKRIVYASQNQQLGCGWLIGSDNVRFPQLWKGQNMLGTILERVRGRN